MKFVNDLGDFLDKLEGEIKDRSLTETTDPTMAADLLVARLHVVNRVRSFVITHYDPNEPPPEETESSGSDWMTTLGEGVGAVIEGAFDGATNVIGGIIGD